MGWIDVNERLPNKGEPCWYFFDVVGCHRGFYGGLYEDEDGNRIKRTGILVTCTHNYE